MRATFRSSDEMTVVYKRNSYTMKVLTKVYKKAIETIISIRE